MRGFGVGKPPTAKQLAHDKDVGIDLDADTGRTDHLLPTESAFVFGKDGTVKFAYPGTNRDESIDFKRLLEAARAAVK